MALQVAAEINENKNEDDESSNSSVVIFKSGIYDRERVKLKYPLSPIRRLNTLRTYTKENFIALPFYHQVDKETPMKMVNLINKHSMDNKYIIAPDGYIPNSKLREKYPKYVPAQILMKKERHLSKEDEEKIENILNKNLRTRKTIIDRSRPRKKKKDAEKIKSKYEMNEEEINMLQNDVMDNFNMEYDKVVAEDAQKPLPPPKPRIRKHKKPKFDRSFSKGSYPKRPLTIETMSLEPDIPEVSETAPVSSSELNILEQIEKKLHEIDTMGIEANKAVRDRIEKDRSHRMTDAQLKEWLKILIKEFKNKKTVFELIKLSLCKDSHAIDELQKIFKDRTKRLAFQYTLTDPKHFYNYMMHFYNNRNEFLDDIEEVIIDSNANVYMKRLLQYCGEKLILMKYIQEFSLVKNAASELLAKKYSNSTERFILIEECIRDGPTQEIISKVFMSSVLDAKHFFNAILDCNLEELKRIFNEMNRIENIQKKYEKEAAALTKTADQTETLTSTEASILQEKEVIQNLESDFKVLLPPLPVYDQNSWKIVMSQYLAQMISSIVPKSTNFKKFEEMMKKDKAIKNILLDLTNFYGEVLQIFMSFLSNDLQASQLLLEGVIGEDTLALEALVELLGESDSIALLKALKLRQVKVMEQLISRAGDKDAIDQARIHLKSMKNLLPPSLVEFLFKDKQESVLSDNSVTPKPKPINERLARLLMAKGIGKFDKEEEEERIEVPLLHIVKSKESEIEIKKFVISEKYRADDAESLDNIDLKTISRRQSVMQMPRRSSLRLGEKEIEITYRDLPTRMVHDDDLPDTKSIISDISHIEELPYEPENIFLEPTDSFDDFALIEDIREKVEEEKIDAVVIGETVKEEEYKSKEELFYEKVRNQIELHSKTEANLPMKSHEDIVDQLIDYVQQIDEIAKPETVDEVINDIVRTARRASKSVEQSLTKNLLFKAIELIEDDEEAQKMLVGKIIPEESMENISLHLKRISSGKKSKIYKSEKQDKIDKLKSEMEPKSELTIKIQQSTPSKQSDSYDEYQVAVLKSYEKQKKLESIIKIFETMDKNKAILLTKEFEKKSNNMTLFITQRNEQLAQLAEMGVSTDNFRPFEYILEKPETIAQSSIEKDETNLIKLVKNDTEKQDQKIMPDTKTIFWEKIKSKGNISEDSIEFMNKIEEDVIVKKVTHIGAGSSSLEVIFGTHTSDDIISKDTENETDKIGAPSSEEIMVKYKTAQIPYTISNLISPTGEVLGVPATIKDPVYLTTYEEDPIQIAKITEVDDTLLPTKEDEPKDISIREFQVQEIKKSIEKKKKKKKKGKMHKSPKYDFQTLYGPNNYYLPYINPKSVTKVESSEDSSYPDDVIERTSKTTVVYRNIYELVEEPSKEILQKGILKHARFIPRHSKVPLNDWIKLGAPGMARNMILNLNKGTSSQQRRDNAKKNLEYNRFGLSGNRISQREEMVEFISRANAVSLSEHVRDRILSRNSFSQHSSNSTVSSH